MKRRLAVVLALCCALCLSAAQSPQQPTPGPEHKKLDYFVGTWTLDSEMKPSQFGPGGKFTEIEHSEWMPGGFFVVSHSDVKSSMGDGTGLAVMGYSAEDKAYTYDAYNSWGEAEHAKGTVQGDTWTWTSEEKMNGKSMKTHFIVKQLSSSSYTFKFEMAGDDGKWSTAMEGKATKQ